MKTNSLTHTSFGAIPLYTAVLSKKQLLKPDIPINAFVGFVEKADLKRTGMAYEQWRGRDFGLDVLDALRSKDANYNHFLMVDVPSEAENSQIRALASFELGYDHLELVRLQSKNLLRNNIKGAGSLIMYALTKIAEMCGKDKIVVYSAKNAEPFYKKMKFTQTGIVKFELPRELFGKVQKKLEEKFNIIKVD